MIVPRHFQAFTTSVRPRLTTVSLTQSAPSRLSRFACTPRYTSTMSTAVPSHRLQNPAVFICDMQEKFRHAIWEFEKILLTAQKVLRAAQHLEVPIYVTTQNRARLGATVPEVDRLLSAAGPLVRAHADKTRFSMYGPAEVRDRLPPRSAVALVGIEAHICVTQTALDLLAAGHAVYVLADAVGSCNAPEVGLALARLRAAGAVVTTSESWLYELMGDAAVPEFRSIVGLVKETSADTKVVLQALLGSGSSAKM